MVIIKTPTNDETIPESESEKTERPIKWSSVLLSDVVSRGKRLDANVFDVEARQARIKIIAGKFPVTTIGGLDGLTSSYTCNRFKRIWVEKSDIPLFQPSSILELNPKPDGYISKVTKTNIQALQVHYGQILMTCSGTIGSISCVSNTLNQAYFSHDLLRIDCNNLADVGYVYTYLKSKIGNKILLTNSYGAVITHIEAEHLDTVIIPNAPEIIKVKINDLICKSYALRDESNELIDQASGMLLNQLRLPSFSDFKSNHSRNSQLVNTFNVKLSESVGRLDASYYLPIVEAIEEHLQRNAKEVTRVSDVRISKDVILPGRFKRVYVEDNYGYPLIGGKQINELDPSTKKYLSPTKHKQRVKDQLELQMNTILITRSGTIGNVAMVPKHWKRWVASEHLIRIVPSSSEIAGYLYVYLSSDYGRELIKRNTYGSVVDEIDDQQVSQILIPLLKNANIQKHINDLALSV